MSETAPSDPIDNLEASRAHAKQAAEELRAAAAQKVHELRDAAVEGGRKMKEYGTHQAQEFREQAAERVDQFREYAEESWTETRTQFTDLKEEGEAFVRQHPAKAVLLALGVGFLIGRLLR